MSRFYASIQGQRGSATRQGGKNSGISGHIRGWNLGVKIWGYVNEQGEDEFTVYKTGGSTGGKSDEVIARIKSDVVK